MLTNGSQFPTLKDKQGRTHRFQLETPEAMKKLEQFFRRMKPKKGRGENNDVVTLCAIGLGLPFEQVEALFEMKELHRAVKAMAARPPRPPLEL